MQEIRCPKCGEVFVVDESGYAQIVQQVRDEEFDRELKRRERLLEEKKDGELRIAKMKQKEEYDRTISKKSWNYQIKIKKLRD